MANLKVKDADAADKYLAASGAGTDIDPHVVLHAVDATGQGDVPVTLDGETVDVSDRAARDLGKVDVAGIDAIGTAAGQATKANSLPVTIASDQDALPVDATGQGDVPVTLDGETVTVDGSVSVDDGGGALTVDGTVTAAQPTHDNLNANANLQIANTDVGSANPVPSRLTAATSGGLSIFRSIDLDESEEAVKASAGQLYGLYLYNDASSGKRYVKFYNATVANVVVGTTTPALTIPLDADQGAVVEFTNGIAFSTAITVAVTTGVADNDTGAPGANEVIANVFYK